jgi:hypothetical protein
MDSGTDTHALPCVGFPIRTSRGQWMVSSSPGLIAAAHVLLRLLAPRHPPCALDLLIVKNTVVAAMEFSRCARANPAKRKPAGAGLSKLNSVERRGRRCSRRARAPDEAARGRDIDRPDACGSESSRIPRKEVIQPQLPLRLPCYDFTPITNPTFDGSLPDGLGHRLRVLPAFVV